MQKKRLRDAPKKDIVPILSWLFDKSLGQQKIVSDKQPDMPAEKAGT